MGVSGDTDDWRMVATDLSFACILNNFDEFEFDMYMQVHLLSYQNE